MDRGNIVIMIAINLIAGVVLYQRLHSMGHVPSLKEMLHHYGESLFPPSPHHMRPACGFVNATKLVISSKRVVLEKGVAPASSKSLHTVLHVPRAPMPSLVCFSSGLLALMQSNKAHASQVIGLGMIAQAAKRIEMPQYGAKLVLTACLVCSCHHQRKDREHPRQAAFRQVLQSH
jgi:hypothetical protein